MEEKGKKLYEGIVDQLMAKIQSGELEPGTRLPAERTLSKEYGVSRSVVREALRAMERMGCVESHVGGGTFVKTPTLSDVVDPYSLLFIQDAKFSEELLETRLFLETEVARLAAQRRTEEQIKAMQKTLAQMNDEVKMGGTGEAYDLQFHAQLVKAANNRALALVISTCSEVLNRTVHLTQKIDGVAKQALSDHEKILKAVTAGDGAEAERCMREHLTQAMQNLKRTRNS